jgi:hypothetical protein
VTLKVFPPGTEEDYGAVEIPPQAVSAGSGGVNTQDEGIAVDTPATTINFVGAGVTATGGAGTTTVTIPGSTGLTVQDEGGTVGTPAGITQMNFVGAPVVATAVGANATITLSTVSVPSTFDWGKSAHSVRCTWGF